MTKVTQQFQWVPIEFLECFRTMRLVLTIILGSAGGNGLSFSVFSDFVSLVLPVHSRDQKKESFPFTLILELFGVSANVHTTRGAVRQHSGECLICMAF